MNVLIRADASAAIGSGHVVRCWSLARALRAQGDQVRFCGRFPAGPWREALAREFPLLSLPSDEATNIDSREGIWLPVTEAEDAASTLHVLHEQGHWRPDWLVVDHYGLSAAWHQHLRVAIPSLRIAVIDDLADRSHAPDLMVDHNTFGVATATRYDRLLPANQETSRCLGPQFALIDPFYSRCQRALPPRQRLRRLLVSLGGAGDALLLEQILQAMAAMPLDSLQVQVVQGGFAQESIAIQSLCSQLQAERIQALTSLAPLMAAADASIGAGGTTTWERLCLGLPSITYALADNQEGYSQLLGDQGLIQYLGRADQFQPQALQAALHSWLDCPEILARQSREGAELVDGAGCERIARLMAAALDPDHLPQPLHSDAGSPCWSWPDGLALQSSSPDSVLKDHRLRCAAGPLRVIDRLQALRRSSAGSDEYLRRPLPDNADSSLRVTVLSSKGSWMNQFIPELLEQALSLGCSLRWIHHHDQLRPGDICFLLSYGRIVDGDLLKLHRHNLVVHASDLPKGKGWSPMTWQILEGADTIPLSLFEASADLDAGPIYAQLQLELKGHELATEWQKLQAAGSLQLCCSWLKDYPASADWGRPQQGEATIYSRRRQEDSRLDPDRTLRDQFPLLRVVDNKAYPAFFELEGYRYRLIIERCDS